MEENLKQRITIKIILLIITILLRITVMKKDIEVKIHKKVVRSCNIWIKVLNHNTKLFKKWEP